MFSQLFLTLPGQGVNSYIVALLSHCLCYTVGWKFIVANAPFKRCKTGTGSEFSAFNSRIHITAQKIAREFVFDFFFYLSLICYADDLFRISSNVHTLQGISSYL